MAGRPKHYHDEELLDRALRVFWSKGYTAASAQDLMQAMDIGQGSFYRAFPGGKKELYQKALKRQLENTIRRFNDDLEKSEQPIQFIKAFFMSMPFRSQERIKNGCFFGNTLVEMSNLDDETLAISKKLLTQMKDGMQKAISKAQANGILHTEQPSETIALYLINLWNGINVTQRAYPDQNQIEDLIKMNLEILR